MSAAGNHEEWQDALVSSLWWHRNLQSEAEGDTTMQQGSGIADESDDDNGIGIFEGSSVEGADDEGTTEGRMVD